MKRLVAQHFAYPNGQPAAREAIGVLVRNTNTVVSLYDEDNPAVPVPNPITTDDLGVVEFYVEPGLYDFVLRGYRTAFDVVDSTGSSNALVFTQTVPLGTWVITHGFGREPAVTLIDNTGEEVEADVYYPDIATVSIVHPSPKTGKVILT